MKPEARRVPPLRAGIEGGTRGCYADSDGIVGQRHVVAVIGGRPADAQRAGRGGHQGRHPGRGGEAWTLGAGRDRPPGEPHEALLVHPVDPGELPAVDDVVAVAGDVPAGLTLTGEGAGGQVRQPVDHRRARLHPGAVLAQVPVRVAVGVVQDVTGGGVVPRLGALVLPGRVLRVAAAHVAAVVGVARCVDDAVGQEAGVDVAVAVGDPDDVGGVGGAVDRRLEGALEVAPGAEVPGGAVDEVVLHDQAGDAGVLAGVAHRWVPAVVQRAGAGRGDLRQAVRRLTADVL